MISKKCGICGYQFSYDDKTAQSPFVQPFGEGAKYYYDLWHFNVERCPSCGYISKDISQTLYKKIVIDEKFTSIPKMDIIVELNSARPNKISDYIQAGYYYESIGDKLNNAKCLLQAGDYMYAELLYWDEYILDSSDSVTALISKTQYNELKKFADYLFNSAVDILEAYVKENEEDVDAMLLLAGSLSDGNKIQNIKGAKLLNHIKTMPLKPIQKKTLEFLLEDMG